MEGVIRTYRHTVDRESSFDLFTVKSSQVSEIFCFAVFKQEFMDLLYSLSSGQRKVRTIIQINWEIVLQLQVDLSVSDSEVFSHDSTVPMRIVPRPHPICFISSDEMRPFIFVNVQYLKLLWKL